MKKTAPVSFVFLTGILLCTSCSHHTDMPISISEADTIRHTVKEETAGISWSEEKVAREAASTHETEKGTSFFNEQMAISFGPSTKPVYPEIPGFGSLDTTTISPGLYTSLQSFLSSLSSGDISSSSFHPDYQFSAVITRYQLKLMDVSFTEFTVGKPYITSNTDTPLYEIPVLAESDSGTWTIRVYLDPDSAKHNQFAIQQVSFEELLHE